MKQFFIFSIFINFISYGQDKSKFQFGIGTNINRTIVENINIDNDPGVVLHGLRKPIGYSLGVLRLKYHLTSRIDIISGIDVLSFQSIKYYFYGTTYTKGFGPIEIPFGIQYNFDNSFFVNLGIEETMMYKSITKSIVDKSDYGPKTVVTAEYYSGFYTIAKVAFGYEFTTKGMREFEFYTSFSKGFKPILAINLERFDPFNKTTFDYQGTKLELGVNWFFKHKK